MQILSSLSLIADKVRPNWVVKSFPIIRIVLASMIGALAIALIVLTLCQETSNRGAGAITGDANTFYNRNKGKSLQGKVKLATIICSAIIVVLCLVYLICTAIYHG